MATNDPRGKKPLAIVHGDKVLELLSEQRELSTEEQNAGYTIMEVEPGVKVGDFASRPPDQQPKAPRKPGE
jgi:hypothetical protein